MLRVTPGHAVSRVQRHQEGPRPAVLSFSQPSLGSCPKKQGGFAISVFSWLSRVGRVLWGLRVYSGYGLPYVLFSVAGLYRSWLLPRAPTCSSLCAMHLCRVSKDLPLGTKQFPPVQLVIGAPFQLLPLSCWGGWGQAASFSLAENSSALLQQATASGWPVASCVPHRGAEMRCNRERKQGASLQVFLWGTAGKGCGCAKGRSEVLECRKHTTSAGGKGEGVSKPETFFSLWRARSQLPKTSAAHQESPALCALESVTFKNVFLSNQPASGFSSQRLSLFSCLVS